MTNYTLSPEARRDLLDIAGYIARHDLPAAERFRDRLFEAFERLTMRPAMGHVRDDLAAPSLGVRFWPVGRYLVVYRPRATSIQIVRVLSAYRDIVALLDGG